jgi:chromosome partitioning protein
MKTIAVLSRKGGAGKTTLSLHLAVAAEALGLRVAILDLDPQVSAVLWRDRRTDTAPAVVPAQAPRLSALLAQAAAQEADLCILDTGPAADSVASEAANHADAVLIPCRPSTLDLDAIGASVRLAQGAAKPAWVVINAAPIQGVEEKQMRAALGAAGVSVCPVVIHQRKAFSVFLADGRTAQEAEPKGRAAEEVKALAKWLCEEVIMVTKPQSKKVTRKERVA